MSAPTNGPSLAVTATSQQVFLGNGNGDHVDSLSLPGLTAAPIACTTNCGSAPSVNMTTDVPLENILWITENGGVFKAPIAVNGSTGAPLAQLPSSLVRMARDASYVYATSQDIGVYAMPLAQVGDGGAFLARRDGGARSRSGSRPTGPRLLDHDGRVDPDDEGASALTAVRARGGNNREPGRRLALCAP